MINQKILERLQQSIPLVSTPFRTLAAELELSERELLAHLKRLKQEKIIRQISGIFDAASLGYQSALVAMQAPVSRLGEIVSILNAHPGVSHNYLRDHPYNLWFTLAVHPNGVGIDDHLQTLSRLTGNLPTLFLPTLRLYKIGVKFGGAELEIYSESSRPLRPLMPWEQKIVLALQEDLPLVPQPFRQIAERAGISEEVLLEAGQRMKREGFLRRFSAVLRHQNAGYRSNIMSVWQPPEAALDQVGEAFAQLPFVSHCYRRPTYPDWPYPLFAMIHAKSPAESEKQLAQMKAVAGVDSFAALKTLQEFKKVRTRYFTPDQAEWEDKYFSWV